MLCCTFIVSSSTGGQKRCSGAMVVRWSSVAVMLEAEGAGLVAACVNMLGYAHL